MLYLKGYQRLQQKYGNVLKKDLAWLRDLVESLKSSAMPENPIDGSKA
jgi:hypothetical protein